jgi:hypothetical protein
VPHPAVRRHDVVAVMAAIEPDYFSSVPFGLQPHVKIIRRDRATRGVRDPDALTARMLEPLQLGLTCN